MTEKLVRTPKEWDEQCDHCKGTGMVHKRERFMLWTADEREPHLNPAHAAAAPSNAYVCTAHAGASIGLACQEGIEIARIVKRPVVFEFNGTLAVCHADSTADDVVAAWDRAFNARRPPKEEASG